jgi:hypothetical protein
MFCKKLCCDITIYLVTVNFKNCIPYSVTHCILLLTTPICLVLWWLPLDDYTGSTTSCSSKTAVAKWWTVRPQLATSIHHQLAYHTSAMNHRICLSLLMHFSVNHSVLYNSGPQPFYTYRHI